MTTTKNMTNQERVNAALRSAKATGQRIVGIIPPHDVLAAMGAWAARQGMQPDDVEQPMMYAVPGLRGDWVHYDGVPVMLIAPVVSSDSELPAPATETVAQPEITAPTELDILGQFENQQIREAFEEALADGYDVRGVLLPQGMTAEQELMQTLEWIAQPATQDGSRAWVSPGWHDGRESRREWCTYMNVQVLCQRARVQRGMKAEQGDGTEFKLRPYQTRALEQLKALWGAGYTRLLTLSVTGSGKTEMFISESMDWIADGGYVIVLAPKRELVRQGAKRMRKAMTKMGLDPDAVGMMMGGHEPLPGQRVIVSTFDSAHKLAEEDRLMVIIDEAHRTGSARVMSELARLSPARTLGVTATPKRKSGQMLGNVYQEMVVALEYEAGFEGGYLVRPRYMVPHGQDIEAMYALRARIRALKALSKNADLDTAMAEEWMLEPQVVGDIVSHIDAHASDRQIVVFCVTVKAAAATAEALNAAGYTAEMICAKTSQGDREAMLARFESGETQILTNVDVLTEGVDVPNVSCIVLARPTRSVVVYIQMVGRGLRPAPGKTDCLVLDHTGTVLELGPVEGYTRESWPLTTGFKKAGSKDPTPTPVSLREVDRECGCGNVWHGGPVCPVCHSIHTTKRFAADNVAALQADLIEYRTDATASEIAATFKGQVLSAEDVIGILRTRELGITVEKSKAGHLKDARLSVEERQKLMKKLLSADQLASIYRQLITWAESKRKPGGAAPEHRAGRLYHDTFGTWPANTVTRAGQPYTAEIRPVVMEIVRLNLAAWQAKQGGFKRPAAQAAD